VLARLPQQLNVSDAESQPDFAEHVEEFATAGGAGLVLGAFSLFFIWLFRPGYIAGDHLALLMGIPAFAMTLGMLALPLAAVLPRSTGMTVGGRLGGGLAFLLWAGFLWLFWGGDITRSVIYREENVEIRANSRNFQAGETVSAEIRLFATVPVSITNVSLNNGAGASPVTLYVGKSLQSSFYARQFRTGNYSAAVFDMVIGPDFIPTQAALLVSYQQGKAVLNGFEVLNQTAEFPIAKFK
jgi:hypothetical protein